MICLLLAVALMLIGGSPGEVRTIASPNGEHAEAGRAPGSVGEATCQLRSSVMPPRPYVESDRTPPHGH